MARTLPTPLEIDATAVTSMVEMEMVSRASRFQAARLAMFRSWIVDWTLRLLKTNIHDMRTDIFSKPVNPQDHFKSKQRLLLTGSSDRPAGVVQTP